MFAKSNKTKARYTTSLASYHQIQHSVAHDGWKWAEFDMKTAAELLAKLEKEKGRSTFWKAWFMSDGADLRKVFGEDSRNELAALHSVTEEVAAFEGCVRRILKMAKARAE